VIFFPVGFHAGNSDRIRCSKGFCSVVQHHLGKGLRGQVRLGVSAGDRVLRGQILHRARHWQAGIFLESGAAVDRDYRQARPTAGADTARQATACRHPYPQHGTIGSGIRADRSPWPSGLQGLARKPRDLTTGAQGSRVSLRRVERFGDQCGFPAHGVGNVNQAVVSVATDGRASSGRTSITSRSVWGDSSHDMHKPAAKCGQTFSMPNPAKAHLRPGRRTFNWQSRAPKPRIKAASSRPRGLRSCTKQSAARCPRCLAIGRCQRRPTRRNSVSTGGAS